jgi:hypothetical protein
MSFKKYVFVLAVIVCFFGCKEEDDITICTLQFVYGLNITLVEANSTNPATGEINATIKDGSYEEVLQNIESNVPFFGAGERRGTYILTITSDRYKTFVSAPILVTADECHVIPVTKTFELTPK